MAIEEEVSSLAEERRRRIVRALNDRGAVAVGELVEQLDVTAMTVWRDLKRLEDEGQLRRVRGGAVKPGSQPEPVRINDDDPARRLKSAIAEFAVKRFVTEGKTVCLDGGSTVAELIRFLPPGIQIMTNSLPVLAKLHRAEKWPDLQCSGGILNQQTGRFTGPDARKFFNSKRADIFFMSCNGLDLDRGLTDRSPLDSEITMAMAAAATQVVALVDSSKLGRSSLEQVLPFDRLTCLVTDDQANPDFITKLRTMVQVETVPVGTMARNMRVLQSV